MDGAVVLFGLIFFLLLIFVRPPVQDDDWYHLAAMRAFSERGFTTHAWWQFAPPGRPHLYPPLLHLVGAAGVRYTPMTLKDVNDLYKIATYSIGLLFMWLGVRLLHGPRVAFWFVVVIGSELTLFYPGAIMILPSSWVLFSIPLILWCALHKRWILGACLVTAGLYTHNGIPIVVLVTLALVGWRMPQTRKTLLAMAACSLVAYIPWLFHLAANRKAIHSAHTPLGLQAPIVLWVIGVIGWIHIRRQCDKERIWIYYALALVVFLPGYGHRFWPYVCLPLAVMAAVYLAGAASKSRRILQCAAIITCLAGGFCIQGPGSILRSYLSAKGMIQWQMSPLILLTQHVGEGADAFEDDALSSWVRTHTTQEDIIVIKNDYEGDRIFALTNRRTTSGGWPEVRPTGMRDEIQAFIKSGQGAIPKPETHKE